MKLASLLDDARLPAAPSVAGADAREVDVLDVVLDTRAVRPGALFCCLRGARVDGHALAGDAVRAGAVAVLAQAAVDVPAGVAVVTVPDVRAAMGPVAASFQGHPSAALTVIGVTGTNGKTTVTQLLGSIFTAAGHRVDVIGTLSGQTGGPTLPGVPAPPTTPDAPALQARLAARRDAGTDVVAMEVSSHGLELHRVDGTRFAAAAFTNLSQDHLDLHGSMEAYFAAKARLFTAEFTDRTIVNIDDPYGRRLLGPTTTPCSLDDASDLVLTASGSSWTWRGTAMRLPIAGRFNVANAVLASTVAAELGVGSDAIAAGLAAAPAIAGRFEAVDAGQAFGVVVDYAHTPDGLAWALAAARELTGGRVIVVFGAGGDRDPGKRPRMGEVAARLADHVVVTSDNPRSEDPDAIIAAVVAGAGGRTDVVVEPDRRRAIGLGIAAARPGDIVVVAGKGHETTQTVGDRVIPFDDRVVARDAVLSLAGGATEDGAR